MIVHRRQNRRVALPEIRLELVRVDHSKLKIVACDKFFKKTGCVFLHDTLFERLQTFVPLP